VPSTTTAGLLEALEGTFHVQTADTNLPNARVATSSDTIEVDHTTGGQAKWHLMPPAVHEFTVTGALGTYLLPAAFRTGDTIRFTITANTTVVGFALSDGTAPDEGTEMNLCLSDQSGGVAPGWTFTIPDAGGGVAQFRTPGQVQGTTPGPSYVMQSEEEGCRCAYQGAAWRIISGTAAQAITGDVLVSAGNGSTRTAAIAPGVIVDADVNASAAIAQTKLGATTGFSVKASGSATTTSAEPIVTYSASANMSAERVLTSGTNTAVDVTVANQIRINVAASNALIPDGDKGDITVSGTGATWNIDAGAVGTTELADDAVTPAKLSHGGIGQTLVSFGSFADPMWCHVMTEQFLGPIGDARFLGSDWIWNSAGSMNVTDITAVAAHAGIRRFTRTAASGSGTSMSYVGDSTTDPAISIADVAFLYFVVRAPTVATNQTVLTDRRLVIGLVADASDASNFGGDGLALLLDLDGATTWRVKDENASASTLTTTVSAVLDGWVECLLVSEGSGNWGVFVNGTDYGTHAGVITSGMLVPAVICNATAATGAVLDVDEFTIGFLPSANRYG
jgi:hypothetical protein